MRGCLQRISVVLSAYALALAAAAPAALAAGGCGGPAESALNQYCESIPSPRGAHPVQGTTAPTQGASSAVTGSLAPATVRRIEQAARGSERAGQPRRAAGLRALLTLPGPDHPRSTRQAAIANNSAIPLWLILVLVAAGLGLATAAGVRWRRGRHAGD